MKVVALRSEIETPRDIKQFHFHTSKIQSKVDPRDMAVPLGIIQHIYKYLDGVAWLVNVATPHDVMENWQRRSVWPDGYYHLSNTPPAKL